MKKQTACQLLVLGLAAWTPAVLGQESLVSTPLQIGATGGVLIPENLRGTASTGPQARVFVGLPLRSGAYLDASIFALRVDGEGGTPSERTLGGGLDLRLERLSERVSYLFFAGGGFAQSKRGTDVTGAPYANLGWGFGIELTPTLTLRTDLRGLARFDPAFIPGRGVTYDVLLSSGFSYSLGKTPPVSTYTPPPAPPVLAPQPARAVPSPTFESLPEPIPALPPMSAPPARVVIPVFTPDGRCPAAPAGAKVDAEGCLVEQKLVLPRSLFFATLESTDLLPQGEAALAAVVAGLIRQPSLYAEISVHTDSLGFGDVNLNATSELADQIRKRLFELGLADGRFSAIGSGEDQPRASEDSDAGIEKNRRVEITIDAR